MYSFLRLSWWGAIGLMLMIVVSSLQGQESNVIGDNPSSPPVTPPVLSPAPNTNFLDEAIEPAGVMAPGTEPLEPINPTDEVDNLAAHLLVVYNQNDSDSKELAEYYAARRDIPTERVLPISCSDKEEITRDEFEKTVRQPILFYLMQKNWMTRKSAEMQLGQRTLQLMVAVHNDIWAIVLMRGVPLKIAPDPADDDVMENDQYFKSHGVTIDPGTLSMLESNAAAVDSELALLPIFGLPRGGFVPNVFFDMQGTGRSRLGPELAKNIILVSRLDGPTPAMVKRMIDDSLYAEKNRLAGLAVIDIRGEKDPKNGMYAGDVWLRKARELLIRDGWVVMFDEKPEVLPATDPLNQVALYMGWYSDHAEGPWITPPNRFATGAIAYHLHSYSASTIRSETENWVGPLIAHGAAASMGTVYEPLLGWTPHEDIFTKRLLDGNYFVEAAYASQLGLSWMTTVVGDPLYRPFRQPLESALAASAMPHTDHDDWLLLQQVRRKIADGQIEMTSGSIRQNIEIPGVGPVAEEELGDLLIQLHDPTAELAYKKAEGSYTLAIDRIRVGIKLSNYYLGRDLASRSKTQLDTLRQLFPEDAARFGLALPAVSPKPSTLVSSQPSSVPPKNAQPSALGLPKPPQPPRPPSPQSMPQQ